MTFESEELQSLNDFRKALSERGQDYVRIQNDKPTALLLDLSNASEHGLLKRTVAEWGVLFSLWKASDAYLQADGEQRKQLRRLLKHLFFWVDNGPTQNQWSLSLAARQRVFKRDGGLASADRRAEQAEALAIRLAAALEKVNGELRIYSRVVRSSLRHTIRGVVKECESVVGEAEYLKRKPSRFKRGNFLEDQDKDERNKVDVVTVKLASRMEWALEYLKNALPALRPVDAYRGRHIIRESEFLLQEMLPKQERKPFYVPVLILLLDATLYASRLLIGFWLIPLVLVMEGRSRAKIRTVGLTSQRIG